MLDKPERWCLVLLIEKPQLTSEFIDQGGEYLFAHKDNRAELRRRVAGRFALSDPRDQDRTLKRGHGRMEVRTCRTITDPGLFVWLNPDKAGTNLRWIIEIIGDRGIDGEAICHCRYHLTSLPGDACAFALAMRDHRGRGKSGALEPRYRLSRG